MDKTAKDFFYLNLNIFKKEGANSLNIILIWLMKKTIPIKL